jgi:hypothetical protein
MSMFRLNNVFWIEILIFRFENNNLEIIYKVLDHKTFLNLNNNFQNWNVSFQIQIIIFSIEMSILESINNFETGIVNFSNPK